MILEVKGYQTGDEKDILALFDSVFGKKRDEKYWKWENIENPRGKSIVALLTDEDKKIRGHLCLHASLFKVDEQYLAAGQRINSMLDKNYRQRGNFGKMYEYVFLNGRKKGISFMFGFPNKQALGALHKISGVRNLGEVPRYVKLYNGYEAAQYLFKNSILAFAAGVALQLFKVRKNKKVKDSRVHVVKQFDSRFDELWFEASKAFKTATVRDSVYLNWRYIEAPRDYLVLACEEKDGSISGYLVLLYENGMGHIIDLLALNKEVIQTLLGSADEYCRGKCHTLSCWCLDRGQVSDTLRKHGYSRIKSQNIIVFNSIDCPAELENILADSSNWYITMGDSDYK
jgi:hypothetical protein